MRTERVISRRSGGRAATGSWRGRCGASCGGCRRRRRTATASSTVAMMPKTKGNPYFVSCPQGRRGSGATSSGVELLWDGPTEPDPAKQNEVVEAWITRGVDVIAVSVENKEAISTVLRKARGRASRSSPGTPTPRRTRATSSSTRRRRRASRDACSTHAARLLGRQGRVRDHHRVADRREPERVDQVHQGAARREVPGAQAGRHPAQRRRPQAGLRRDADAAEGPPGGEGDHGDRVAGGAGRGRGGEAVGAHRREGDRPRPAEHVASPT